MEKPNLAIAYAMKKKSGSHMCSGGDCSHSSHMMADGGEAKKEKIDYSYKAPHLTPEQREELDRLKQEKIESDAADVGGIRSMRKGFGQYAEGGSIDSWTKREDNERGINRDRGNGMSSAGLHVRAGNTDSHYYDKKDSYSVAKREHGKTLGEMRSMPKPKLMAEGGMIEDNYQDDDIHPMIKRIMMSRGGMVANEESGESTDEPTFAKADGNEFDDLALRDDLESSYTGSNSGDELGDAEEDHEREDIVSRIMKSRAKKDRMAVQGEGSSYGRRK